MVAAHPYVQVFPAPITLGVGADLRDSFVNYPECIGDNGCILALGVGCLVDTGEGDERVAGASRPQPVRCLFTNAAVDRQPPTHIAAEMRGPGARHETSAATDSVRAPQSAADDAQRAETWLGELEDRGRSRIDVAVNETHLRPHIASRMTRYSADAMRSIVPSEPRKSDAAR